MRASDATEKIPGPVKPAAVVVQLLIGTEGGGIVTAIKHFVPAMQSTGWNIRFVVLSEGKAAHMLRQAGLDPCVMLLGKAGRYLMLGRRLRMMGASIIHTHNPSAHLMGLRAGRSIGAKVCRTIHADMFEEMRGLLPAWKIAFWQNAMRYAYGRSDAVVTVSPHLVERLPASEDARRRVLYLPNGYDVRVIDEDRSPLPDGLGEWLGDRPLAVTMGRLVAVKNYGLLIRAWAHVARTVPDARLVIAGAGPMQEDLERQIRESGVGGSVRMLAWVDRVAPMLKRANVVVMSSLSECCPMLVLEAMTAGKALVSTAVGGIPWMVKDGETARLTASEDVAELARCIAEMLKDRAAAQQMGQRARALVERAYSAEAAASKTARLYNRMLVGGQPSQTDVDGVAR